MSFAIFQQDILNVLPSFFKKSIFILGLVYHYVLKRLQIFLHGLSFILWFNLCSFLPHKLCFNFHWVSFINIFSHCILSFHYTVFIILKNSYPYSFLHRRCCQVFTIKGQIINILFGVFGPNYSVINYHICHCISKLVIDSKEIHRSGCVPGCQWQVFY